MCWSREKSIDVTIQWTQLPTVKFKISDNRSSINYDVLKYKQHSDRWITTDIQQMKVNIMIMIQSDTIVSRGGDKRATLIKYNNKT